MYRFLRITPEKTYATYDATSTQGRYLRMDAPNTFKPMQKTQTLTLPDPVLNRPVLRIPTNRTVGGKLTACVYIEDALVLLGLAGIFIDSGKTAPWVTTDGIANDLGSATFDFAYTLHDGTVKRKRYLGCKAMAAKIYCREGNDPRLMVDLDIIGKVCQGNALDSSTDPDATAFPEPTEDDYSVLPYLIFDTTLTVAGVERPSAKSIEINIKNNVKAYFDTKRLAQRVTCRGRTVTWGATWLADGNLATDRAAADEQTDLGTGTVAFASNNASVAFDFQSKNKVNSIDEDMPLDEDAYYTAENQPLLDSGVDMALTIDIDTAAA